MSALRALATVGLALVAGAALYAQVDGKKTPAPAPPKAPSQTPPSKTPNVPGPKISSAPIPTPVPTVIPVDIGFPCDPLPCGPGQIGAGSVVLGNPGIYVGWPFPCDPLPCGLGYASRGNVIVTTRAVYRRHVYRGVALQVYTPLRHYSPAFYAWASGAAPSSRLADYLLTDPGGAPPALAPEVKKAVAGQIDRQIAIEKAESEALARRATSAPASSPAVHVFVAPNHVDVTSRGKPCQVSRGDVLRFNAKPAPDATGARLEVLSSRPGDCRTGAVVTVSLKDLQELHNHMRETLDQGLAELYAHHGGLPAPPASAMAAPTAIASAAR